MNKIIPTIFSKNRKEFQYKYNKLINVSKNLQIDFMDGKFVKNKSIKLNDIPKLPKGYNFEAHLMCKNPEKYIAKLREKEFKKVIFHFNSGDNVKTISKIKNAKMKAFLAVNPEDKVRDFCYLFDLLDGILVMGVHPGKEHQRLLKETINKIKKIRKINNEIIIQVDGGVNPFNINKLKKSGARIFNTGSFVAEAKNPKEALGKLIRA